MTTDHSKGLNVMMREGISMETDYNQLLTTCNATKASLWRASDKAPGERAGSAYGETGSK